MDLYKKKRNAVAKRTSDPYRKMTSKNGDDELLVMILTQKGILYCVNVLTRAIKWQYDTKKVSYQSFQRRFVTRFVDIGEDDDSLCFCSSEFKRPINWNNKDELNNQIKDTLQQEPTIDMEETDVFYLTNSGDVVEEGDNTFKIKMTEWDIGVERLWYVRYLNLEVYLPCDNRLDDKERLMCRVHYARTPERVIELFNLYGLRGLDNGDILTRTINSPRKIIFFPYPRVIAAEENKEAGICYFRGSVNDINVFMKRTPNTNEYKKIKDVYTKFSQLECVVRLIWDESDEKYMYFAFEEFEMNLSQFAKKTFLLDEKKRLGVVRAIVKALIELHENHTFHGNLAPENILIKETAAGEIVIRFCGLGNCKSYSSADEFYEQEEYLDIEKQNLGETLWNYLTSWAHSFMKTDYHRGFTTLKSQHKKVDLKCVLTADIIHKLLYSSSSLPLNMVTRHIAFWEKETHINFLRDMSDEIVSGEFENIDDCLIKFS